MPALPLMPERGPGDASGQSPAALSNQHLGLGRPSPAAQAALWLPGLLVAAGAIAATAHGLYEVAIAAHVPPAIAWIYPVITDGLALVAYGAATRTQGPARNYSWAVVVVAAGLSGLAQAAYLAGDATVAAPAALRFGVGAWPAIAAAVVAHLLHLLANGPQPAQPPHLEASPTATTTPEHPVPSGRTPDVRSKPTPSSTQPAAEACQPSRRSPRLRTPLPTSPTSASDCPEPVVVLRSTGRSTDAPVRDRARAAADEHTRRHGTLPTVSQLQYLAAVSRGTAGEVLKTMREQPLHLVTESRTHGASHHPGEPPNPGLVEQEGSVRQQ
jgi:hypothetical protein